jgi:hypothetical protein
MEKMIQGKKGLTVSYKMVMWIPRFLYTVFVIGVTFFVIFSFITTKTNVTTIESRILTSAVHFYPNGISAKETIGNVNRLYPGQVDTASFSTITAESILMRDNPAVVGKFNLTTLGIERALGNFGNTAAYTDYKRYFEWLPIAQLEAKGEGAKSYTRDIRYVVTKDLKGKMMETVYLISN